MRPFHTGLLESKNETKQNKIKKKMPYKDNTQSASVFQIKLETLPSNLAWRGLGVSCSEGKH